MKAKDVIYYENQRGKFNVKGFIKFIVCAILALGIILNDLVIHSGVLQYFLYGSLCFLAMIGVFTVVDWFYDKKVDGSSSQSSREERWRKQAEQDKLVLESGDPRALEMKHAIVTTNALWESTHQSKNTKHVSELYLEALTAELFLENYNTFKAGQHDDIKDKLYVERPYLVLETLINMGLYIFKTNNNIHVLEYIIKSDNNQFLSSKPLASLILARERQ